MFLLLISSATASAAAGREIGKPIRLGALLLSELSFLEAYRGRIIAVITLCILQSALILLLLANRSKRRKAEKERNTLAAIVASSDDAIFSNTLEGTITSWNAGASKLYGYTTSEMLGRSVSILLSNGESKGIPEMLERIRHGEVDYLETELFSKDGRQVDVSLTISPIRTVKGTIAGAATIARDITARKQADQKLREGEERFRMMADTAPVMIWVAGPDASLNFFNRQWLKFTGRTMEHELGMGWTESLHPEDYERCMNVYRTALDSRQPFTMEYRMKRSDGQYRWVDNTGVPRLMSNGDLAGFIGTCLDITERKQADLIRQRLTSKLLMMQDEERQRIAGELHNGLGQSLAIIRNRATLSLRDDTPVEFMQEQLREISATAAAAAIEVRQIAHNLRPYELDRLGLISAIEAMVQRVSESTTIVLSTSLDPIDGLLSPEAETSVYRIVQECLNNVIKHSCATAARIEIRNSGNQLAVSMTDNGIGIPSSPTGGGSRKSGGVGLAGIAERVRALGGSLQIDSLPNQGTKLTIHLEPSSKGKPQNSRTMAAGRSL